MNWLILTLSVVIVLLIIALVISIVTRPKVITVYDTATKHSALKLQNEIRPFIKEEDGKAYLKVVKW